MRPEHTHATEAQLIELALAGLGESDAATCETCCARVQELRGFLDDCRRDLLAEREESAAQMRPFVERVLSSTSREDLGWRGDLRLVGSFVNRRLSSSRALRFAAASLAVHLLVLPVVAWMVLREAREERILSISIEGQREQALPAVPIEHDLALVAPDTGPEPELVEVSVPEALAGSPAPAEARRSMRLQRSFLLAGSAPAPASLPGGESVLAQLFLARSEGLHGGRGPAQLPLVAAGLERALLAEVLLDTWLLEGRRSARLESVLRELGGDPGVPVSERRLERLALVRARIYGLLDEDGRAHLSALTGELQAPVRSKL